MTTRLTWYMSLSIEFQVLSAYIMIKTDASAITISPFLIKLLSSCFQLTIPFSQPGWATRWDTSKILKWITKVAWLKIDRVQQNLTIVIIIFLFYHSSQTVGLLSIVLDIITFKNSKQQKGLHNKIQEQNSVTCYKGIEPKYNMHWDLKSITNYNSLL